MNSFKDKKDGFLVEMSLLGDQRAYEELVVRHEMRVKGTALKVTENEFSAEDASQDAFVSAWVKLDSLKDPEKFGAWVCSIAKNCALDIVVHYRSAAADISLSLLENTEALSSDESGLSDRLNLRNISEQERDERLREAVEVLSEKIRETVKLHYFHGLSVAEIAKKQGLPVGTVKWQLHEGRKQLRKEYGVMETRDENATFVQKVMYQVEQLKLFSLKNDRSGFEAEYRRVLCNVEKLEESDEKQHALADVLLRGYWWLPGQKNDEMLARIKASAEKSRNEEVLSAVLFDELEKLKENDRLDCMLNEHVPYLEKHGFTKALGAQWFWIAYRYCRDGRVDEGMSAFDKVLEVLEETDMYYANALAAKYIEQRRLRSATGQEFNIGAAARAEVYKTIGGRLYLWAQPGYSSGALNSDSLYWNCSGCDALMPDETYEVGQRVVSSDGKMTMTCKAKGLTVSTAAGEFEDCTCFKWEGDYYTLKYCETYFCPGIGLIRQTSTDCSGTHEWQLSGYRVTGGEGFFPNAPGNRWEYSCIAEEGVRFETESVIEVVSATEDTTVLMNHTYVERLGYDENTWRGNILKARYDYVERDSQKRDRLVDVRSHLDRAAELAGTKRQRTHTAIARQVLDRILATDPGLQPDYTQKGRWNFFGYYRVTDRDGVISLDDDRTYSFEWKYTAACCDEGQKVFYSWPYSMLTDEVGATWSPEWVPGYHTKRQNEQYGEALEVVLEVLEDEAVTTAAGTFDACRHVGLHVKGHTAGRAYMNGRKNYWFAPGVGVVKFTSSYKNDTLEAVWELTAYTGTGEGYFPLADGLVRRYEPKNLGNGWHGSVEYTFDGDESGLVIFRNALGTQDRANFEADSGKAPK